MATSTVRALRAYCERNTRAMSIDSYQNYELPPGVHAVDVIESTLAFIDAVADGIVKQNSLDTESKTLSPFDLDVLSDPRYHAAVALEAEAKWDKETKGGKSASKLAPHLLVHTQVCNQQVWAASRSHTRTTFFQEMKLDGPDNPFRKNPAYLLSHDATILRGLIPLAAAIFYQYLSIVLLPHVEDAPIESLEISSLRWEVLRSALSLGASLEGLVQDVIARFYQVWRLTSQQCAQYQKDEGLVSFLAYSTTLTGFKNMAHLLYERGGHSPILQAMGMALTCHDVVASKSMASLYPREKFQYLLTQGYLDLERPILFVLQLEDTVREADGKTTPGLGLRTRALRKTSSWKSGGYTTYSETFTYYLIDQLPLKATEDTLGQFLDLEQVVERGAPLPIPCESMPLSDTYKAYESMLSPWNKEQQASLLEKLVKRRVNRINIPIEYQSKFVGLMIEELGIRKETPEASDLQFFSDLAPLVSMKESIRGFSARKRWSLLVGFFHYGRPLSGFLEKLFASGVNRMSDYTKAKVNADLHVAEEEYGETKGATDIIRSWDQIVSEFARLVKDPVLIQLWLPPKKPCDFALSLFLWALHASSNQIHPLVSYLIENGNVRWNDAFVFTDRLQTREPPATSFSGGSVLHAWFATIPKKEKEDTTYWINHRDVLKLTIAHREVFLPDAKNQAKQWSFLVLAFTEKLFELWRILCDRREPASRVDAKLQTSYKNSCIDITFMDSEPDVTRMTDIGIYPNDKCIFDKDALTEDTEKKIRIRYLKAVSPTNTRWFRKFLDRLLKDSPPLLAQLKELHKDEHGFNTAVAEWEKSSKSNRSKPSGRTSHSSFPDDLDEY
jgi:hypothetical protein